MTDATHMSQPGWRSRVARAFREERAAVLLAAGIALIMVLFLLVPVFEAIAVGFYSDGEISGYWFMRVVSNPILMQELLNTAWLATVTTAVCVAISLPLAIIRARYTFRGAGVLAMLLLVPLILPPFVGAIAMKRFLGQFGVFNLLLEEIGIIDFAEGLPPDWLGSGFVGVVILQALHLFPILYLNLTAALANIDPALGQAARNLGASRLRTFLHVTFPLLMPGLFAGGTIVFIWAFTDIGTPIIVGYEHLTPVTIFKELATAEVNPRTYSLVFILLSASLTFYLMGKFFLGMSHGTGSSKATIVAETSELSLPGTIGAWLLFGTVIFLSVLPHIGVLLLGIADHWVNTILPTSYTTRHLVFVFASPDTFGSILNSLKYAGIATLLDIIIGAVAAWIIIRTRVAGRSALDTLCMLPLAVPGLILAAGYVAITAQGTWLESIGPTQNPFIILVVAYAIRRIPFVVRGVSAGLQQVSEALEEAARNLGAGKLTTSLRITMPLIAANIIAAGVLTFSFHMLEVSDSLILAQTSEYYPITKQIYRLATSTGSPEAVNQAAAMGIYGILLLGVTMGLASALLGKRLGAVFRA
ncbi:MAG: ABC transporter permease [Gammaproteobacteria bacterium]|nr:ABC transporter permease [Gammaproteobacteria bacterium]